MDVITYAAVVDVCARLAGRLSDDVLDSIRVHYAVGESYLAEATLLLSLAHEGAGITDHERDLIRSMLDDPDNPELDDVLAVDEVPQIHRFGPGGTPDPRADALLAAEAPKHGGRSLHRAWREPHAGSPATWVYVVRVAPGTDELLAYSGLSSQLSVELRAPWLVEVVTEGRELLHYQAAALAAAVKV
jgi:hypothetical protein